MARRIKRKTKKFVKKRRTFKKRKTSFKKSKFARRVRKVEFADKQTLHVSSNVAFTVTSATSDVAPFNNADLPGNGFVDGTFVGYKYFVKKIHVILSIGWPENFNAACPNNLLCWHAV